MPCCNLRCRLVSLLFPVTFRRSIGHRESYMTERNNFGRICSELKTGAFTRTLLKLRLWFSNFIESTDAEVMRFVARGEHNSSCSEANITRHVHYCSTSNPVPFEPYKKKLIARLPEGSVSLCHFIRPSLICQQTNGITIATRYSR